MPLPPIRHMPLPPIRVRAVKGALVPYETDPRRYVGLRRVSAKEAASLDEALVMHRIPGVLADGTKRAGKEIDVVFVAEGVVEVPRSSYYVRALMRAELELAGDKE